MKELSFEQMENYEGGGPGRTCMIAGGLATLAFLSIPVTGGGGFLAGLGITAGATYYGCFD